MKEIRGKKGTIHTSTFCCNEGVIRRRKEEELEVAEIKMLIFSLGVTRMDRIRNEVIGGTTPTGRLGEKARKARLRWFGQWIYW